MLTVRDIHKSYGFTTTLAGVTFSLARGEKVAIVGPNGGGKSTLLKIIAGIEEPDRGSVTLAHSIEIGYLPQQVEVSSDESIVAYLRRSVGLTDIEREMHELEMSSGIESARYAEIRERFQKLHGYAFEHRAEVLLDGFGLKSVPLETPVNTLSGGQKAKVALTGILLKGVDLLLLDEPTNNLDLPALEWLEYFIKHTSVACIIVSHDRRFLDATISKIGEIDWFTRSLHVFSGTYTAYLEHKKKQLVQQHANYERQQESIARLEEQARRKKVSALQGARYVGPDNDKMIRGFKRERAAKSSRVAKTIEKRIEQMDKIERPPERDQFVIPLGPIKGAARNRIDADSVCVGYPGFSVGPFSFSIEYGARVAIVGNNGSGKTTVLKVLTGMMEPLAGTIKRGSAVILGVLDQDMHSVPLSLTPIEFLTQHGGVGEEEAYHLLDRFAFEDHEGKKKIKDFSVGGRVRLLLALFSAQHANVLVLDEPTNHLDVEGLDALETVLKTYEGTIILTSHDRYFLELVQPTYVYEISDGTLTQTSLATHNPKSMRVKMERLMKRFKI